MPTVTPEFQLLLCTRARIERTDDELRIFGDGRQYMVRSPSRVIEGALARLAEGEASEDDLCDEVLQSGEACDLFSVVSLLRSLDSGGLLRRRIVHEGRPLATLTPVVSGFRFEATPPLPDRRLKLSRFAYLRSEGGLLRLESPVGRARLELHERRAGDAIVALTGGRSKRDLDGLFPDLDGGSLEGLLVLMQNVAALVDADDMEGSDGGAGRSSSTGWWEFHDLLFHMRSRRGRHDAPYGGTYPHKSATPPPLVKPRRALDTVALPKPDLDHLKRTDPSFAHVLERRRSVRTYAAGSLTVEQLGEFLYRCARYQRVMSDATTDYALRPSPAGGGFQELELYPFVARCRGLEPGVYHYRSLEHELTIVARPSPLFEHLLDTARAMTVSESPPDVYFQITARCHRVFWKYESMAYALILKNLGALYATMYLAATAMDLAPCALGGGDSELFSTISGIDPSEEPAVGEFVLGARAAV